MLIRLPEHVKQIIDRLHAEGFAAYAVGGCVRDAILGREPDDWDITTQAKPVEIKRIFRRTVDTGIEHGTVTVLIGSDSYEVTTFRADGAYEDMRHPSEVTFVPDLQEDLLRRDFTINAMAYAEEEGLIDLYGGMDDLNNGVIRCVGNPDDRFTEDALRMLRAVRFAAQLGFSIEEETADAIRMLYVNIDAVSRERIRVELVKLLTSAHPETWERACELGVGRMVLPVFQDMYEARAVLTGEQIDLVDYSLKAVCHCGPSVSQRLTALLYEALQQEEGEAPKRLRGILKELTFDNHTVRETVTLTSMLDEGVEPVAAGVRRAMSKYGKDMTASYIDLLFACNEALHDMADGKEVLLAMAGEELNMIGRLHQLFTDICEEGDCTSLKELAVSGQDLLDAGVPEGAETGRLLNALLDAVLEDPSRNTREQLLALLEELRAEQ